MKLKTIEVQSIVFHRKPTMVIEREGGCTDVAVNQSGETDENNERDKLVQFETPEESALNAQKYFSSVSSNLRK